MAPFSRDGPEVLLATDPTYSPPRFFFVQTRAGHFLLGPSSASPLFLFHAGPGPPFSVVATLYSFLAAPYQSFSRPALPPCFLVPYLAVHDRLRRLPPCAKTGRESRGPCARGRMGQYGRREVVTVPPPRPTCVGAVSGVPLGRAASLFAVWGGRGRESLLSSRPRAGARPGRTADTRAALRASENNLVARAGLGPSTVALPLGERRVVFSQRQPSLLSESRTPRLVPDRRRVWTLSVHVLPPLNCRPCSLMCHLAMPGPASPSLLPPPSRDPRCAFHRDARDRAPIVVVRLHPGAAAASGGWPFSPYVLPCHWQPPPPSRPTQPPPPLPLPPPALRQAAPHPT